MLTLYHIATSLTSTTVLDKLRAWYEGSLLRELIDYVRETYFTLEFGVYDNISIDPSTANTAILRIILGIMLGLIIASAMITYTRTNTAKVVKRMKESGADSPETAKTLSELGLFRSSFVRRELKGGALRRAILCREEEELLEAWRAPLLEAFAAEEAQKQAEEEQKGAEEAQKQADEGPKSAEMTSDQADAEPAPPSESTDSDSRLASEAEEGSAVEDPSDSNVCDASSASCETKTLPLNAIGEEGANTAEPDAGEEGEEALFDPLAARRTQLAEDARLAARFGVERPAYRVNYTQSHFYMPDDLRYHAEFRFTRRGATWGRFALTALVILIIGGLIIRLLPAVVGLLDGLVSMMAPND